MKITNKGKLLMKFFTNNKYINHTTPTENTKKIITKLYHDIYQAYEYVTTEKKSKGKDFYGNFEIKYIENISQISKPTTYNTNIFPNIVRSHINEYSMTELIYTFNIYGRNIKIIFNIEDEIINKSTIKKYNNYVDSMLIWLYILNKYSYKQCSKTLVIYLFFTSLNKTLPESNVHILDEINVNTAFTPTCLKTSEIVIFRKEEWFKVFIHESFHNFGLDFSDMNINECTKYILKIFPVKSQVNLYESYTECWAEIINSLFCSFFSLKSKTNQSEFIKNSIYFINFERTYSFFQLVKVLDFMGLKYIDLFSKKETSELLRKNMYREKTNVLAYYIIKTILINNYQGFLSWCNTNNDTLLDFRKTISNQKSFCKFVVENYKTKSMMEGVNNAETLHKIIKKGTQSKNKKEINTYFILDNLRMSMCELG